MTDDPTMPLPKPPSQDPGETLRPLRPATTGGEVAALPTSADVGEAVEHAALKVSSRRIKARKLGPYELLGMLGRGGMGAVYEAFDTRLSRRVALKVMLASDEATAEERERFHREAAHSAKLRHPNIVPVHDVGHEEGRDYLVMDLVEGVTLGEALRQRQFTYREKAALLEKVARAVQYAHSQGVIHRDLKPGNIMLDYGRGGSSTLHGSGSKPLSQAPTEAPLSKAETMPQPAKPADASEQSGSSSLVPDVSKIAPAFFEPLVMDFGLAKDTQQESGLSRTGQALGTPAYMAPEQAEGKANLVGPRSDVYSLGAILYEMLAGRPPFVGENALQVMRAALHEEPVPPRVFTPGVPRDLETICLKCLEKELGRRYASAAEFADDLKAWLNGDPISARRQTWAYRLARKAAKHRVPVALASALLLLCVGFGGWYGWEYWKTYGKWTLVFEQDFSRNQDLSGWEFWDWRNEKTVPPFPVENGSLRPRAPEWCWLKDVRVPGEVRLEVRLYYNRNSDGLDLCINSHPEQGPSWGCPAGYSCQVGGYNGTVDFVSRNDQPRVPDTSSGAPSLIRIRQMHTVVFEREGGVLSLSVDGVEVSRQVDLLPIAGANLHGVGLRTWAKSLDVHSVTVYRRALAQKANPVVAGDALVKAGRFAEAEREYRDIATDYPGTAIADLALTKAFLVASARGADGRQSAAAIRTELDRFHPRSPHRAQVLEASAFELWKEGNFREALDALPSIWALDADSRVVLRMLNVRREALPDDIGESLLHALARIRKVQHLDVSGLSLTSLEPLRVIALTSLYCGKNRLTDLEPLRAMQLANLDCAGNELATLEPLRGMPLTRLECGSNKLTSLEPLRGMPLTKLDCRFNQLKSLEPLRGMSMYNLGCNGNRLSSLEPLEGMPLTSLNCHENQLTNLEPLRGMPLTYLNCNGNKLTSLEPLRGMPLTTLLCAGNRIASLEPLRGMPLAGLHCALNQVTSLEPLRGMPLSNLYCESNQLTSLEPFAQAPPLGAFYFDCETLPDAELERALGHWGQRSSCREHARFAQVLLALRKGDAGAVRALGARFQGHAYLFVPKLLNWVDAKACCEEYGGHLATVTSQEENQFLYSSGMQWSWIGLSRLDGRTTWVTGEPVSFQSYFDSSHACRDGRTYTGHTGMWGGSADPSERHYFVIEWDE